MDMIMQRQQRSAPKPSATNLSAKPVKSPEETLDCEYHAPLTKAVWTDKFDFSFGSPSDGSLGCSSRSDSVAFTAAAEFDRE